MLKKMYIYTIYFISLFMFTYVESGQKVSTSIVYGKALYGWLLLILCIEIFNYIVIGSKYKPNYRYNLPMYLMLFALLVSVTLSNIYLMAWDPFKNTILLIFKTVCFVSLPLLIMVNYKIEEMEYLLLISNIAIWFATVSSVVALWTGYIGPINILGHNILQYKEYERLYGWYGNPNRLGGLLALALLFSMYSYKQNKDIKKLPLLLKGLLIGITLFLTGNRGSIFGFTIGALSFIFITMQLDSKNTIIKTLKNIVFTLTKSLKYTFIFIIGIYIFLCANPSFINKLNTLVLNRGLDSTGRVEIWQQWPHIYDFNSFIAILFGHGHGYFSSSLGASAHNGYIRWFVDYGLVFILFFVMLIAYIIGIILIYGHNKDKHSIILSIIIFCLIRDINTQSLFTMRPEYLFFLHMVLHFSINEIKGEEL